MRDFHFCIAVIALKNTKPFSLYDKINIFPHP